MTNQRRVTITGGSGQLGAAMLASRGAHWQIDAPSSDELDVRDWRSVRDRIATFQPDLIVHAAAATDVDGCERDPQHAYAVNGIGARNVARAAAAVDAELVYVSTNYVFDGRKDTPYHEFDVPEPLSVYGASKLAGEIESRAATPRCYIVRTAWLYAAEGRNFVNTMRRLMAAQSSLRVVNDQRGNPTFVVDLAGAIVQLCERAAPYGVYHAVNSGVASWHAWAQEIARQICADCSIDAISAAEYRRDATPPTNGALESLALPELGIELPDWRDALRRCLHS